MEAILLGIMMGGVALFQLLLALGFPYGHIAWGGQHKGVLPTSLRIGSAIAALLFIFSILVVLSKVNILNIFPEVFEKYYMWFITTYFVLGTIMNAISRSKVERLWAPYSAVMLILSLRLVV